MNPLWLPGDRAAVELVIASDIARRLGLSRQRVHQLAALPGFPRPIGRLGRSDVWRLRDTEAWAERTDRHVGP